MKYFLLLSFIVFTTLLTAQNLTLKGKVVDSDDGSGLAGAHLMLSYPWGEAVKSTAADAGGSFIFTNVEQGGYLLTITYLGYEEYRQEVTLAGQSVDLGILKVKSGAVDLGQVEVKEKLPLATQQGDTIQYNADAFKTLSDASAEELIEKMPTVSIENGKIQAEGEDVKQVLVDGRPFFGNDPTAALRNLPAEVISKIQVFDERSDQSQFTGFDDGQTTKTINIITRANMRQGQFGKMYGGYGYEDKYQLGGNVNIFDGDRRISFIGLSNNINIQNFSQEDLLGVIGSGGRGGRRGGFGGGGDRRRGGGGGGGGRPGGSRGGGGGASANDFLVPNQGGIATSHALGLNYTDKWGEKFDISGSYFFNYSSTDSEKFLSREYVDITDPAEVYSENSIGSSKNINHRLNLRLEYDIDSLNSIIMRPRLTMQQNDGFANTLGTTFLGASLLNQTDNNFQSDLTGLNFSNNLLYRRKLNKDRRTLSLNVTNGFSPKKGNSWLKSQDYYYGDVPVLDSLNQFSTLDINSWNVATTLSYTEPIGRSGMLMASYRASWRQEKSDKETYDFLYDTGAYDDFNEQLSNIFSNDYFTHDVGAGINFRKGRDFMFMARASVEWAQLLTDQSFPEKTTFDHTFFSIQPFVMLRYSINQMENLRIFYRSNTQLPSIEQLQNVIDNTNPLQLSVGNPELVQSFQHNLFVRYSKTNTEKATVFYALLGGGFTNNYIGNSTFLAESDDPIFADLTIQPGAQLIRPVNLDGYWNLRSFVTYGVPFSDIKSNLNFNVTGNFTRVPGLVNGDLNYSNNKTFGLGLVLSSNISQKIDFTISSRSSLSDVKNSLQENLNNQYFNQNSKIRLGWVFGKGLVFRTNLTHQLYTGLSDDFNQNYWLWGMDFGKKLFKNQRGEINLSIFDLLKQNRNIDRNVTDVYIEDVQTQALQRFVMLKFTYNLRHFNVGQR